MKILYIHQHFVTPRGKGGIRSYCMAQELLRQGHEVTMLCGQFQGSGAAIAGPFEAGRREGMIEGIRVVEFELPYSNKVALLRRAWLFLKFSLLSSWEAITGEYDLVFATSTPLTVALPGILAKLIRRRPFVFEVRDLWPELPKAMGVVKNPIVLQLLQWLESLSYWSADRVIALSPGMVQGIQRKSPRKSIAMIPNGCDREFFDAVPASGRPESLRDDDFVAVYAGTHGLANGLKALLPVAEQLLAMECHHIKIVLVGDGALKPQLQAEVARRQLGSVIRFLEPMPKKELIGFLKTADVGLQVLSNVPAFYYGTSPNKFFDYLSAPLPVLINYPGWCAQLVETHRAGVTVMPENAAAFAQQLLAMSRTPQAKQAQWRENASALAAKFDRQALAKEFAEFVTAGTEFVAETKAFSSLR